MAIVGLVARFHAPSPASPRTRGTPPPGYGVREQCLPFTAAAATGIAIPSPFAWGFCLPGEVPAGARAFRSPIEGGCPRRVFYILDDVKYCFERNQFLLQSEVVRRIGPGPIPGLSFFDRPDQQDHVKLHLPYVLRTAAGVGLLFTAPLNRPRRDGLGILSGLVESDWYTAPVNLVLALPPPPQAVHVTAGEIVAQALPIPSDLRQPRIARIARHCREARDIMAGFGEWREYHDRDRSAYKRLAKSRHGALPDREA